MALQSKRFEVFVHFTQTCVSEKKATCFFQQLGKETPAAAACFMLRFSTSFPITPTCEGFSYQPGIIGFDGAGDLEFDASVCEDSPSFLLEDILEGYTDIRFTTRLFFW